MKGNGKQGIVVETHQGMATIKEGGAILGIKDGTSMTCQEFNAKVPAGAVCTYNPVQEEQFSPQQLRRMQIKGSANRARARM